MKLIFALGNPGKEYEQTRHNVGFAAVDSLAHELNANWQEKTKFKAVISEVSIAGEKILLAKPTTFYNQVGESFRALLDFYKLEPEDILLVHDELALPIGTVRLREGGSDAGNNGIKSILQHGGGQGPRVRVGISNDQRALMDDANFVLGRFTKEESEKLADILKTVRKTSEQFARSEFELTSIKHD
jgi:PTH1 family peptidyl-tRNA hydrolase